MVILLAVVLALALLYFWLLGHWFARVLVFLLALGVGLILADPVALIVLGVVGWFGGGIPVYVRRRREVRAAAAQQISAA